MLCFIKKKLPPLAQGFPSSLQPNRRGFSLGVPKLRSQEGSCGSQAWGGREIWGRLSSLGRRRLPPAGELSAHTEARYCCPGTALDQGRGLGRAAAPTSMQKHPCTDFASAQQTQQVYGSGHFISSGQHIQTENAQERQKLRVRFVADLFIQLLHANLFFHLHLPSPACALWLYLR